jgi:beta-N-acetylhexosaminidase
MKLLLSFFLSLFFVNTPTNKSFQKRVIVPETVNKNSADSLDIKIGQMIIFGFYGTKLNKNDAVYKAVKDGLVGSILIYRRNIAAKNTSDALIKLIAGFQEAAPSPLFVSIDQEGGMVNRFKGLKGFPAMPSAYFLGKKNDTATTRRFSDNITSTLSGLGFNLNYAPSLDIHNANCPVIGARERSFSKDPMIIAAQAEQVIKSHNALNIGTVIKHFPGHGNSTLDSHLGVTDVTKTWKPDELIPYKLLIEKNMAEAVMTAHIVNGNLDESKLPATLSKKMITGLLRDSLHFNGVIFSDDMMMQAISKHYGLEESIFLSINAGLDILMFSNNIKGVKSYAPANIHSIIKQLVRSGKLSEARINASYDRIMAMKANRAKK